MKSCAVFWTKVAKQCESTYDRINSIMLRVAKQIILQEKKISMYNAFEKLNWLSCEERYEIFAIQFVFKQVILNSS